MSLCFPNPNPVECNTVRCVQAKDIERWSKPPWALRPGVEALLTLSGICLELCLLQSCPGLAGDLRKKQRFQSLSGRLYSLLLHKKAGS